MARRLAESGFALLIVLWALVLLTLLMAQLTASGRTEAQLALNLRTSAVVEAAADGAVFEAVFHLLNPQQRWPADGAARKLRVADADVVLRIVDEGGKLNPNTSSPELMRALLRELGVDTRTADQIATAIVDWRFPGNQPRPGGAKAPQYRAAGRDYGPPAAPFRSVDELGLVLGVTPELMAKLAPHLSIYADGDPSTSRADPLVMQAIRDARGADLGDVAFSNRAPKVVAISAAAEGALGTKFMRQAVIRLTKGPHDAPFEVLTWEAPSG